MFKNATLYKVDRFGDLDESLLPEFGNPGPLTLSRSGLVAARDGYPLLHTVMGITLMRMCTATRVVPAPVIKEALKLAICEYKDKMGVKRVGKRAREQLKARVIEELLPKAFIKRDYTEAVLFPLRSVTGPVTMMLAINSASEKVCETLVAILQETFANALSINILQPSESPSGLMTGWMGGRDSKPFDLGQCVDLADPLNMKSTIRVANMDLALDVLREHVNDGMLVKRMELSLNDRISFVMDSSIVLRRIRLLELSTAEIEKQEGADADAQLIHFVGELEDAVIAIDDVMVLA